MTTLAADAIIEMLNVRGVTLTPHGTKLRVSGTKRALTPEVRQIIREQKRALLDALTRPESTGPSIWARKAAAALSTIGDDEQRAGLRYQFEERAGICEYEGGLSREEAERLAYEELAAALKGC